MLKPFKYIARVVYLEENNGEIVGEHTSEEVHLYSKSQISKWLEVVDEFAKSAESTPK